MSSGLWKHLLILLVVLVILACHFFARIPGFIPALYVVAGTALLSLFVKRHFSPGRSHWSYVLLALVVVLDRLVMSPMTWGRGDQASLVAFWQTLIEPGALLCLVWLLLSQRHDSLLAGIIFLAGLPFSSGGFTWAFFPLVALMVLGSTRRGCTRREGIGLFIAVAGLLIMLVRSPCFTSDNGIFNLLVLFLAGFWMGGASRGSSRSLILIALALVCPVILGLAWSVFHGQWPPSHEVWGINPNLASAQGCLGLLLLFLRFRIHFGWLSWLVLGTGVAALIPFGSIWTVACLLMVVLVSIFRRSRFRAIGVWFMAAIPLLTLLFLLTPAELFPSRIELSVAARQFHWRGVLGFLTHHPFGEGFGMLHPRVLGFAEPADQLASIPGSLMQHAHHFLLQLSEYAGWLGILLPLLFMIPWVRRFSTFSVGTVQWGAGAGFLFGWASNAADLSALSPPFILATGMLLGMAQPSSEPTNRCGLGRLASLLLLTVAAVVWFSGLMGVGSAECLRRGQVSDARRLATVSLGAWPSAHLALDVVEEMSMLHPLLTQARDDSICPATVARKVKAASRLLARGRLRQAELLLKAACRLDPWGVLQHGGATARVYLATLARERGDIERGDSLLAVLCWRDAAQTRVAGEVDYYLLRGRLRKARNAIRRFTARTAAEKKLRQSLLARINRRPQAGHGTVSQEPTDRLEQLKQQIDFLLASGRVSQASAAYEAAQSWLGDDWQGMLIQSKIAVAQGDVETAIATASKAVSLSGGALHARWELVRMLVHGQRREEAYRQAQLIVDQAPQNGEAWLLLGETLLDLGKGSDAKRAMDKATGLGADDLSVGIATAQSLRMMGQQDQAEQLLIRLARSHESSTWPLWQLASWAEEKGDLRETLRWGMAGLRRDPGDPGCNVIVGRAFRKRGQAKQAMTFLSRVSGDRNAPHGWRIDADAELELLKQQYGRGRK